jgi:hypothetical protein
MDQTCPVVHKSRRPQARLKTVTLFYIHCELYYINLLELAILELTILELTILVLAILELAIPE